MIHDMAFTQRSKIIFHFPLGFDPAVSLWLWLYASIVAYFLCVCVNTFLGMN